MIYILFLIFTFVVLFVAFYQLQYFMVFKPIYFRKDTLDERFEVLSIKAEDGLDLEGVLYQPETFKKTILFFAGRSLDGVGLIKLLSQKFPDSRVVCFNYRAYGKNGGKISEKAIFADSLHISKIIQKNYGDFYLLGFSLGSSVSSYVASKHKCLGVILVGVYDSVAEIVKTRFGINLSWILRYKFDNTKFVSKIDTPTYIYVSKMDETTYIQNSRNLKSYVKNLALYKELDNLTHKELFWSDEVINSINNEVLI